ncbi:MAG: RNA 3'-terminal phosphate cyclase, partial [Verrucomicrobiales bacterium]
FLQRVFLPMVEKMGGKAELSLERPGFAPAGGGMIRLQVPGGTNLRPIEVLERGGEVGRVIECVLAHVKESVARREFGEALSGLGWDGDCSQLIDMSESSGAGNVLAAEIEFENVRERVTAFGAHGKRAKQVAREVVRGIKDYLGSGAVIGRRLGDQLLLPMALAGGGRFVTMAASNHLLTNAAVIEAFLPLSVSIEERERGACLVVIAPFENS